MSYLLVCCFFIFATVVIIRALEKRNSSCVSSNHHHQSQRFCDKHYCICFRISWNEFACNFYLNRWSLSQTHKNGYLLPLFSLMEHLLHAHTNAHNDRIDTRASKQKRKKCDFTVFGRLKVHVFAHNQSEFVAWENDENVPRCARYMLS